HEIKPPVVVRVVQRHVDVAVQVRGAADHEQAEGTDLRVKVERVAVGGEVRVQPRPHRPRLDEERLGGTPEVEPELESEVNAGTEIEVPGGTEAHQIGERGRQAGVRQIEVERTRQVYALGQAKVDVQH